MGGSEMTPTPRTDAEILRVPSCFEYSYHHVVTADFARTLERENAELLEALEKCLYIIGAPTDECETLWRTDDELKTAYDAAVAVIAKAKGKP
jgi:hypothetical protein